MAYSTQSDLLNQLTEKELIELTDDARTGSVDAAKVTAAISAADATIDSYTSRYGKNLVVTEKVKALSLDLAIFELEKRRRRIREATQRAHDAALSFLKDVSAGRAVLDGQVGGVATTQVSESDVKQPDRDTTPRVFDDGQLDNY